MYKIILVDDESLMLDQLTTSMDWENLGFELVGSFTNGKEALDFILKNKVDAVISDILMPVMSGLELAKALKEISSNILISLVSAYPDFPSAQKAIEYNVIKYLTKPLTYSALYDTIVKFKQILDDMESKSSISVDQIFFQQLLTDLFYDQNSSRESSEISDKIKQLNLSFPIENATCALLNLHINNSDKDQKEKQAFFDKLQLEFPYKSDLFYSVIFRYYGNDIELFVLFSNEAEHSDYAISLYIDSLKENILKDDDITLSLINIYPSVFQFRQNNNEETVVEKAIPENEVIDAAISYVEQHYSEQISLTKISNHVNFSPVYFCRYFKQNTGKNISDFIIDVRLKKAAELLKDENAKISSICEMVGYKNKTYFYNIFKTYYNGLTPLQYQQKMIEEKNKK